MVADMSVGVGGMIEIDNDLEDIYKANRERNEILNELLKLKKIELTNKKPEVMFLFELLDFLKSIPRFSTHNMNGGTEGVTRACFVSPKWNGKIIFSHRDYEHMTDFYELDGEAIYFDILYYINKLSESLNKLYKGD